VRIRDSLIGTSEDSWDARSCRSFDNEIRSRAEKFGVDTRARGRGGNDDGVLTFLDCK